MSRTELPGLHDGGKRRSEEVSCVGKGPAIEKRRMRRYETGIERKRDLKADAIALP